MVGEAGPRSLERPGPALTPPHLRGLPQRLLGTSGGQSGQPGLPLPDDLHAAGRVDLEQLRDTCGTRVTTRREACPEAAAHAGRLRPRRLSRSRPRGTRLRHARASLGPDPPGAGTRSHGGPAVWSGSERLFARLPSGRLGLRRPPRSRAVRSAELTWMSRAKTGVLARRASCSRALMLSAAGTRADVQSCPGRQAPETAPGREPQGAPGSPTPAAATLGPQGLARSLGPEC